jgi:hypothetical protein
MTPPGQSNIEAVTSKWRQDGGFRARCYDCDFRMATKTSPQSVVKRHVERTGHRVEVERSQWKLVEPDS